MPTNAPRCGFAALVLLCLARTLLADGLIIVENSDHKVPGHFPFAPMEVSYHHVDVAIRMRELDDAPRGLESARRAGRHAGQGGAGGFGKHGSGG